MRTEEARVTAKYGVLIGWHTDADGQRWARLDPGTVALTASACQLRYAGLLRDGVDAPLRLSRATLEAMAAARQRMQEEREQRAREDAARAQRAREREHALASWAAAQEW